ncbi:MAG: PQQ-dependent sugar dehydrogenase [Verrucomicrobiota bacterium]|nr:PQQ-dependent sugar dehydrogenase [Verrucomicrobiota bacterium]
MAPRLSAQPLVNATSVVSGLSAPVAITNPGDQRLFITEQAGRIRIVDLSTNPPTLQATPFLDIHTLVKSGGEQGCLSVAFDPISANGFYVYYTDLSGNIVIANYSVSADPNVANTTGTILLTIPHPTNTNHNGGQLQFGRDNFLYLGTGDGGSSYDPPNNAQTKTVLLGKILRLKMNGAAAYEIPPGNPFPNAANPSALPEIWAYGLRNPFRFTVDRRTGDLLIGDVGQDTKEEVDLAPSGVGGLNFGWRVMEGTSCTGLAQLTNPPCNDPSLTLPILEYADAADPTKSAVIGGVRYRGTRLISPATYLYADFYDGVIRQGVQNAQGTWSSSTLLTTGVNVSAFGQDKDGEVYFTSYGGTLYKLNPADTDADGLPDWWESQYFGSTSAALPNEDSDGDGLTNAQEFLAGTDPQSGASALRVSGVTGTPPVIEIDFPSVFGKSYQLEYKDDLTATIWISLGTPLAGTGAIVEATDTSAPGTFRFYRIRLL